MPHKFIPRYHAVRLYRSGVGVAFRMQALSYLQILPPALEYLNDALRFLPALPGKTSTVPQELERYEEENNGYKKPMAISAVECYPERCRISMLRLKADILFSMGNTEELRKLLPALSDGNYGNIKKIKGSIRMENNYGFL